MSHDPFLTIGNAQLCAWRVQAGDIRVQTRAPELAKKLAERQDSKLVAWSVYGGYLKIFRFDGKTLAWAERLIKRYQASSKRTNEAKIGSNGSTPHNPGDKATTL